MTFKVGQETICYQHQEAQNILEKMLIRGIFNELIVSEKKIKEAIEWITKANDSAVRMENKLKEYKTKSLTVGTKVRSLIKIEVWGWEVGDVGAVNGLDFETEPQHTAYRLNINNSAHWVGREDFELVTGEEDV